MERRDRTCLELERRVAGCVADARVLLPGEHALLLLSGGADSMALLAIVRAVDASLGLGLAVAALHVDYAMRGADSDRDRALVVRACEAAGVPLHVVRLERALTGPGFQARARDLRYRRARDLAARHGYDVVVTAHNRDDQAETVLYRLAKYASPRALVGIRPRDGDVARPLLCLGAGEVRAYCRAEGIEYGEDVTNADPVYARNLLRLEVLPRLRSVNPRVAETLAASARQAAAEEEVLAAALAGTRRRVAVSGEAGDLAALDLAALAAEPPALRALLLHDVVREAAGGAALVERRVVEALLRLVERRDDAGSVSLGRGLEAVRGGGVLRVRPRRPPHRCPPVAADVASLTAAGLTAAFCGASYRLRLLAGPVLETGAAAAGQAFVGLAGPPRSIVLRHPRRGERFDPLGLGQETTVARHLAGARVPAAARPLALVVEVDGRTAWVGHRTAGGAPAGRVARDFRVAHSSVLTLHVSREAP